MAVPGESLEVDPTELRLTADKIDGHASTFASHHQKAHTQAGQASLGSGLAGAALPEMLAAWNADGTRFGNEFTAHAEGHRVAASLYAKTDADNAGGVRTAGSGL